MPVSEYFSENDADRIQTKMLLEYGQESVRGIALIRQGPPADDGAGGVIFPEEPTTQDAKPRFFQATSGEPQFVTTSNGQSVQVTHVLIGRWDDDIQSEDAFMLDGQRYEVIYVDPDKRFQVKAKVREIGNP